MLPKTVIFAFCSTFLLVTIHFPFLSSMREPITFENIEPQKYHKTCQLYNVVTNQGCNFMGIETLTKDSAVEINIQTGPFLNTLLHTAIIRKYPIQSESIVISIINALLENKSVNLVLTNNEGNTPLHSAIEERYFIVAKILIQTMIERNFDLNTQNKNGDTALHLATKYNQIALIAQLLQAPNIQINLPNNAHKTATDLASDFGFKQIENLLIQHDGIFTEGHAVSRVNSEQFGEIFPMDL